ncbi:MAG TPA: urea ABC transporter permease subunit UrtC [Fibrobacteria bacterium]|nr:urea ABC transporter permease subunit UrtC [Fibrobacteria bacterium]
MIRGNFYRREAAGLLLAFVLILLVPVLNTAGLVSDLNMNLLGRYLCFALVAVGIDLIWGYTGILSLCQALFFCLGGYCIGMHMLLMTGSQGVYGSALPDFMVWTGVTELPWFWKPFHSFAATLLLGLSVPTLAAAVFGFFAFRSRIKGVYFSIISQALALATWLIFLRNETRLGGTNGLTDFKTLLGFHVAEPSTRRILYIVTAIVLMAVYFAGRYAVESKFGKTLVAIRDSETRVRFTGIPVARYKIFVFAAAALIAGLAGMLYVPQTGIITPGRMDVRSSLEMVVWVAVGGRATLMGPIIGAIGISLLYSWLTGTLPGTWLYVLGGLFIVVVLFMPQGFAGLAGTVRARFRRGAAKEADEGGAA